MFASLATLLTASRYEYYGSAIEQVKGAVIGSLLTTIAQFCAAYLVQFVPQTSIEQRYFGLVYTLAVSVHSALVIFIATNFVRDHKLVEWLYGLDAHRWLVAIVYGIAGTLLVLALTYVDV